jgi:hypothetical protein
METTWLIAKLNYEIEIGKLIPIQRDFVVNIQHAKNKTEPVSDHQATIGNNGLIHFKSIYKEQSWSEKKKLW